MQHGTNPNLINASDKFKQIFVKVGNAAVLAGLGQQSQLLLTKNTTPFDGWLCGWSNAFCYSV